MTIAAWVKVTDFTGYRSIVSKSIWFNPAPYDFYLAVGTGLPQFFRGDGVGGLRLRAVLPPPPPVSGNM